MSDTVEIRFEVPRELLVTLDAYCQARNMSKTAVMTELLSEWSAMKAHEWTLGCRMLGINPLAPDRNRN